MGFPPAVLVPAALGLAVLGLAALGLIVAMLGPWQHARELAEVRRGLGESDPAVRLATLDAFELYRWRPHAREAALAALSDPQGLVRARAALLMVEFAPPHPEDRPKLESLADDPDPLVVYRVGQLMATLDAEPKVGGQPASPDGLTAHELGCLVQHARQGHGQSLRAALAARHDLIAPTQSHRQMCQTVLDALTADLANLVRPIWQAHGYEHLERSDTTGATVNDMLEWAGRSLDSDVYGEFVTRVARHKLRANYFSKLRREYDRLERWWGLLVDSPAK